VVFPSLTKGVSMLITFVFTLTTQPFDACLFYSTFPAIDTEGPSTSLCGVTAKGSNKYGIHNTNMLDKNYQVRVTHTIF